MNEIGICLNRALWPLVLLSRGVRNRSVGMSYLLVSYAVHNRQAGLVSALQQGPGAWLLTYICLNHGQTPMPLFDIAMYEP